MMIVVRAVECERKNGNVVNGLGFDQRLGDTMRDAVVIGLELVFEFDQALFDVFAHFEPNNDQRFARP